MNTKIHILANFCSGLISLARTLNPRLYCYGGWLWPKFFVNGLVVIVGFPLSSV